MDCTSHLVRQNSHISNSPEGLVGLTCMDASCCAGLAGSRSGALIATAWASLVYNGIDGYKAITEKILGAATGFKQGLRKQLPQLEIVGDPQGSVVAFKSTRDSLNIYKVHDLMMKKGWHLSSLQFPPALHMCFTGRNQATVENLLQVG